MSYLKTHWLYAITAVAVLCVLISAFLLVRARQPPEPTTVYVMPEPNPNRAKILADATRPKKSVYTPSKTSILDTAATPRGDVPHDSDATSLTEEFNAPMDRDLEIITTLEDEQAVAESPFGFGPYPEVPSDYPDAPIWEEDDYPEGDAVFGRDFMRSIELIERVLIKLWSQGHRVSSGSTHNGFVLPHYPNTVYVEWSYLDEPDGTTTRYVSGITSGPDVSLSVHDAIMDEGIIPSGITVLDGDSEGIDPYSFLNLNQ